MLLGAGDGGRRGSDKRSNNSRGKGLDGSYVSVHIMNVY